MESSTAEIKEALMCSAVIVAEDPALMLLLVLLKGVEGGIPVAVAEG